MRPTQETIRIAQARGDLVVTREVLAALVAQEALGTPGVVHLGPPRPRRSPGAERLLRVVGDLLGGLLGLLLGPLAARLQPPAPVTLELGDGELAVEVVLVARHGVDLAALASALRARVTRAVRGMTGLEVRCLDVLVVGLVQEAPARGRPPVDAAAEARRRFRLPESV
ncbi:MAG: Asp23/Gls24 family envelope stress response protein [Planctomycetes bacterium]|nr:Asp23/Gls24 family envelope stress response protein [Planctomycetota bacterium]